MRGRLDSGSAAGAAPSPPEVDGSHSRSRLAEELIFGYDDVLYV